MNEYIKCQLFNVKYIFDKSLYTLINGDNNKIKHKIKFILKNKLDKEKISIQFKIYTVNINCIEFVKNNKTIKITNINSDGFLFSFDFDNLNNLFELVFYSTNYLNANIFIKKIIFNLYQLENLLPIVWDNIFVINLKRRNDRKINMINNFNKIGITNYEFITGVDGLKPSIINKFNDYKNNFKTKIITSGHFACLLSHIKAIRIAKQRGYTNIMILEDDVYFCDDFIEKISKIKIPKYDMIYLGGIINQKKIFINNCTKTNGILGAYGYILTSKIFDFILDELEKLVNYVDLFFMEKIQPNFEVFLLDDFIKTNLDSSDTSCKSFMMTRRLFYIK